MYFKQIWTDNDGQITHADAKEGTSLNIKSPEGHVLLHFVDLIDTPPVYSIVIIVLHMMQNDHKMISMERGSRRFLCLSLGFNKFTVWCMFATWINLLKKFNEKDLTKSAFYNPYQFFFTESVNFSQLPQLKYLNLQYHFYLL